MVEATFEVGDDSEEGYNSNRRTAKRKTKERLRPGVSPLVYTRFLLEHAVFLSLMDMGKDLPEYEEFPIALDMPAAVSAEYTRLQEEIQKILKHQPKIANKILSSAMNLLTVYPDQPYAQPSIENPLKDGEILVIPKDTVASGNLHPKDLKLLELVEGKVKSGERVLIYTSWVRIDTQEKLQSLFGGAGYKASVLRQTVAPEEREDWVMNEVANGTQILITNPTIVETGLDLNDFTTLIYYNIAFNLFTLRQSSRRSWRINQTAPRIEVYFFCYKATIQERTLGLMASKLAAAGLIEGQVTDEGLAAMSDCQDLTSQLAKELTRGIRDEVEDLSGAFKRMAILKSEEEKKAFAERHMDAKKILPFAAASADNATDWKTSAAQTEATTQACSPCFRDSVNHETRITIKPVTGEAYADKAMELVFAAPIRGKKAKTQSQVEDQISFFDLPA